MERHGEVKKKRWLVTSRARDGKLLQESPQWAQGHLAPLPEIINQIP